MSAKPNPVSMASSPRTSQPQVSSSEPHPSSKIPSTKAERRELQESQRAAKKAAALKSSNPSPRIRRDSSHVKEAPGSSKEAQKDTGAVTSEKEVKRNNRANATATAASPLGIENWADVALFSHLMVHSREGRRSEMLLNESRLRNVEIHPEVIKLGLLYRHYRIVGSNERAIALLRTFRMVIEDYESPPNSAISRHLDSFLKPQINYLVSCRPMSVSMGTAIRFLKCEIAALPLDLPQDDAKMLLDEKILNFVRDRITCADTVIIELGMQKIQHGDVLLTFGYSTVIQKLFIEAKKTISFRVIVVDSRPLYEGKRLLCELQSESVDCTYVHMNALSFVMKQVSKVFFGAHALLSNGVVLARSGTAMVALMAHTMSIPVICCCETYKFSERVQLDSIVSNEIGDCEDLVPISGYAPMSESVLPVGKSDGLYASQLHSNRVSIPSHQILNGWQQKDVSGGNIKVLSLLYDVTPSEFVTVVITEVGLIPCTSVPVIIREGVKAGSGAATPTASFSLPSVPAPANTATSALF